MVVDGGGRGAVDEAAVTLGQLLDLLMRESACSFHLRRRPGVARSRSGTDLVPESANQKRSKHIMMHSLCNYDLFMV